MRDHPLIWAMAKANWEDQWRGSAAGRAPYEAGPFERLPQARRDDLYDAMHAALKALREPTADMVSAGAYCEQRSSPRAAAQDQWRAMIDKLLEVK